MKLSKTNYLLYRDCIKNAWLKINKPEVYNTQPLSEFEILIIESGNEIDVLSRDLFPGGILIEDRNDIETTEKLVNDKTKVIYQPVFETENYKMIPDIIVWNEAADAYDIFEVKSSSSKAEKNLIYTYDIAFQYAVLKTQNIPVNKLYLIRLDKEYIRGTELEIHNLFKKEDFTERVKDVIQEVESEMEIAHQVLSDEKEPHGECRCITRGRSSHCTTFSYSNPDVPEYSIHDIARIGMSKKKLKNLVDSKIYSIFDVPDENELSDTQKNQVLVVKSSKKIIDEESIKKFLDEISYPISFLDYETFPSAIPRFSSYSPYKQIPFQFSLHIASSESNEPEHLEFIHTENTNPDESFIQALKEQLPESGSIIVWHKSFETSHVNKRLIDRNPQHKIFLENLNSRVIDLEDVFKKQLYVHKEFKGKTSIKWVLPALVPDLKYTELEIQDGAGASDTWNKISQGKYDDSEKIKQEQNLLEYCKLDTYAMYAIWKHLIEIIK